MPSPMLAVTMVSEATTGASMPSKVAGVGGVLVVRGKLADVADPGTGIDRAVENY